MILDLSVYKKNINQLYHPTGKFNTDFYEKVYTKDIINENKFSPIFLKEWFYLVKRNGLLVIDYKPNENCNKEKLEDMMQWLWKKSFKIVSHQMVDEDNLRFVCKKLITTKNRNDDINKWTFGIVTNGKRLEWLEQLIQSIRMQKISCYEIIICGTYPHQPAEDIKYIPFNKRDDKGWITKKKNLIVENAKYENICMLHDRIILNKDWYLGMKMWGNCFENLGCRQLYKGKRVHDWVVSHFFINNKDKKKFAFESYADYRDWYKDIWFMGQLNIFKKSIITKNNLWWDEKLYVGDREDYELSKNFSKEGFIHRFNDAASVETLINKYVNPTWIKYDPYSIIPKMQLNSFNALLKLFTYLSLRILFFFGVQFSFKTLENTRGKIYTFMQLLK